MTISTLIALITCNVDSPTDFDLVFPDYTVTPVVYAVLFS